MKKLLIATMAVLTLLVSGGVVSAGNGFAVTYPPDSDNLNLKVGSLENVEVHIMNNLGMSVAVGISDDAGNKILVSYPTDFDMNPGEKRTVLLTIDPLSGGDFDITVHISARTPGGVGGGTGGKVVGGMDIPLEGTVAPTEEAPTGEEGIPYWPFAIAILAIVVIGALAAWRIKSRV